MSFCELVLPFLIHDILANGSETHRSVLSNQMSRFFSEHCGLHERVASSRAGDAPIASGESPATCRGAVPLVLSKSAHFHKNHSRLNIERWDVLWGVLTSDRSARGVILQVGCHKICRMCFRSCSHTTRSITVVYRPKAPEKLCDFCACALVRSGEESVVLSAASVRVLTRVVQHLRLQSRDPGGEDDAGAAEADAVAGPRRSRLRDYEQYVARLCVCHSVCDASCCPQPK